MPSQRDPTKTPPPASLAALLLAQAAKRQARQRGDMDLLLRADRTEAQQRQALGLPARKKPRRS